MSTLHAAHVDFDLIPQLALLFQIIFQWSSRSDLYPRLLAFCFTSNSSPQVGAHLRKHGAHNSDIDEKRKKFVT